MTQTSFHSARARSAGAVALALILAAAQPAAADSWHGHYRGGGYSRGGGIDAGAAAALGLITGIAIVGLSQPTYRQQYYPARPVYVAPPRYAYAPAYVAPAPMSPLARAFVSQDPNLRVSIQYSLRQQGFYNSTIDGIWGPATQGAIYNYAQTHNELAMLTNEGDANQLFADILR